ncbi:hypothetical protein BKA62DRAFT_758125 [Auriculariales sp. MPI-PUGE-AT-0066]|nr:hypothetical protein BKA62DRAFT_758125 [Auriculariales sp. MPI-PUGE-AT-0066]
MTTEAVVAAVSGGCFARAARGVPAGEETAPVQALHFLDPMRSRRTGMRQELSLSTDPHSLNLPVIVTISIKKDFLLRRRDVQLIAGGCTATRSPVNNLHTIPAKFTSAVVQTERWNRLKWRACLICAFQVDGRWTNVKMMAQPAYNHREVETVNVENKFSLR